MDGRVDGWMDGWVGGWMDGWMGGSVSQQLVLLFCSLIAPPPKKKTKRGIHLIIYNHPTPLPVLAAHLLELEVQDLPELRLAQRQKGHHL